MKKQIIAILKQIFQVIFFKKPKKKLFLQYFSGWSEKRKTLR